MIMRKLCRRSTRSWRRSNTGLLMSRVPTGICVFWEGLRLSLMSLVVRCYAFFSNRTRIEVVIALLVIMVIAAPAATINADPQPSPPVLIECPNHSHVWNRNQCPNSGGPFGFPSSGGGSGGLLGLLGGLTGGLL